MIKYLLPIFCFNVLSAEFDVDAFNAVISKEKINVIYILGNSNITQKVKITVGGRNNIEIKPNTNISISEDNLKRDKFGALCFVAPNINKENLYVEYIEYLVTLKKSPELIFIENSTLVGNCLKGNKIKIKVKNNSTVALAGCVNNQVIEIDNTSLYDAELLKTKITNVLFDHFSSNKYNLQNCNVIINASEKLNIVNSLAVEEFYEHFDSIKLIVPVLYAICPRYAIRPKFISCSSFYSLVQPYFGNYL